MHSVRSSQAKYIESVVGTSNLVKPLLERGNACLVRQQKEVIVEPESINASDNVLNPAPSAMHLSCTPSHTLYDILDVGVNQFASHETKGEKLTGSSRPK